MGEAQWMIPAPTGIAYQNVSHSIALAMRGSRLGNAEATADELRDLAKLLRGLDKEIFQGGQNTPFVSAEAERIRHPIVYGWYDPLPGLGRREHEQQRLFDKVGGLLGEIASRTADSPRERLKSLATDVDELVAKIDPQSATVELDGDPKFATEVGAKPKAPKTEGAVSQGVFVYNGERAENIPPAPWRLLEFMEAKSESDSEEAYQYAIDEHDKDSTPGAIKAMLFKANQALLEVRHPKQLSKPKGVRKIVWV